MKSLARILPGMFLVAVLATVGWPRAQEKPEPLTLDKVLGLLVAEVPLPRVKALVAEHGVDFALTDETEKRLRTAGATDEVILQIVKSYRAKAAPPSAPSGQPVAPKVTPAPPSPTPSAPPAQPVAPSVGTVSENAKDGLPYVWIPPGTFMMGCSPGDGECYGAEQPRHQVTLTRGFWMGRTEVTVAAYKRFATAAGRQMPSAPRFNRGWANDNMPVVNVSWDDAERYCSWAGGRLPTEAEWEYAARGGSTGARYGEIGGVAWHHQNSGGQTHEVAQKRANGFGLYDTLGNVWEWVNDWYDENYYRGSPSQDPSGPTSGPYRILRGGSWGDLPVDVHVFYRSRNPPGRRNGFLGFRCVREVGSP